jgi:hypothetical protein
VPDLTFIDYLRVEKAVWTVDAYLSPLPARRQREIRHELRANLRASAAQSGAKAAVRGLGSLRRLGYEYLSVEYRGRPWPTPIRGVAWTITTAVLLTVTHLLVMESYVDGLTDAGAEPGTYTLRLPVIGLASEITVDGSGDTSSLVLLLSLPVWLAWLFGAFVVGSRLWRAIPRWRDRRRDRRAQRDVRAAVTET